LVVDDDNRIRSLLKKFLIDNGFFVSEAEGAATARELLAQYDVDLIIADVMMPDESGIEFTRNFRKTSNKPVLMLTAMGDVEDRISGLESGADDYLPKPFEPRELLLRVKSILQRTKKTKESSSLKFGDIIYHKDKDFIENDGVSISVTSNEIKFLKILANNLGQVVSRESLAEICGGINERSVDVQITRLRNKIEKEPKNPVYLKTVRGLGYILHAD